jgi:hypothetical protein
LRNSTRKTRVWSQGEQEPLTGAVTAVTGGTPRRQKRHANKGADYLETGNGEDTAFGKADLPGAFCLLYGRRQFPFQGRERRGDRHQICLVSRKPDYATYRAGKVNNEPYYIRPAKACYTMTWQQYRKTHSGGDGEAEGFAGRGSSPRYRVTYCR